MAKKIIGIDSYIQTPLQTISLWVCMESSGVRKESDGVSLHCRRENVTMEKW